LELSPRLRWKLDQVRDKVRAALGGERQPRPKLCPSCGTLVGATASRCHQCGANLTFSLAAASKSLGRLMPGTSPATYGILSLSCLLYAVTLLETLRLSGFEAPGGGFLGLANLGGINTSLLSRLGASLPLGGFFGHPGNLAQPWRFVTAIFLHASLLHIFFNMWVLMDLGPLIEEIYGSARYLFIYVATGVGGYLLSSATGHLSVGGSGAILGLVGVLLGLTAGRRSGGMQELRSRLILFLVYVAFMGFVLRSVDNYAHLGGFATGFLLGKLMTDRPPANAQERKWAYGLGWASALVVAVSFVTMRLAIPRVG